MGVDGIGEVLVKVSRGTEVTLGEETFGSEVRGEERDSLLIDSSGAFISASSSCKVAGRCWVVEDGFVAMLMGGGGLR